LPSPHAGFKYQVSDVRSTSGGTPFDTRLPDRKRAEHSSGALSMNSGTKITGTPACYARQWGRIGRVLLFHRNSVAIG
jgi:hypothetical protein